MEMKTIIARWFAWLRQAVSAENETLSHVYSDGRRLWATDGHVLHALDVALEKAGSVSLDEDGLFQVAAQETVPPFADTLPAGEPLATVVVSAEALRQAAAGQEGFVRLRVYGAEQPLELASGGKYALVMPATGVEDARFWRPEP